LKDTNFLLASSEQGLSNLALDHWRHGYANLYVEQEVGPTRGNRKNLIGSALLALDAELVP
jgi:hypothetical protein